jgi:hypothetical protein
MRVLFYLEPALFRDDPLTLLPWAGWVARIAKANAGRLDVSCAGNRLLMAELRSFSPVARYVLTQFEVLEDADFDRVRYARDLFREEESEPENGRLLSALRRLAEAARPDVVVSFSQNRYLRRAFQTPVLFSEMGPLPRSCCRPSLFFDVVGHQVPSSLSYAGGRALHQVLDDERAASLTSLLEPVTSTLRTDGASESVRAFLAERADGHKLALLATQPRDWLTYEGAGPAIAPADLLLLWAARLPPAWVGIVSYHPAQRLPVGAERLLAEEQDNLLFLPHEEASGRSEFVIPHVDGIVTISSTVALQGALLGTRLVSSPNSAWSAMSVHSPSMLEAAVPLTVAQRASLLHFLTNRYCHPMRRVLDEERYFSRLLEAFAERGFDASLYFDPATWSLETARELLSPESSA